MSCILSSVHVDAGTGELTLKLDNGTLDLYGFAVGTESWLALDGSGFSPNIKMGPLTINSGSFGFTLNTESGTATPITDWSFAKSGLSLAADSFDVSISSGVSISLSSDFVSVSAGTLHLTRVDHTVGPTGTGTGTLVTLSLTSVSIDASAGGATLTIGGGTPLDFYFFTVGDTTWTAASARGSPLI